MNWRTFTFLLAAFCLISWTLAEVAEARGRGGSRGSGGGGSFSRGSGSFGSIRNSGGGRPDISRPSTRDIARPSQQPSRDNDRFSHGLPNQFPATGGGTRPTQRPAQGGDRLGQGKLPSQLPAVGSGTKPSQLPSGQKDRVQNLTPQQKDQLRQKFQNNGLKPTQLPAFDRDGNREDWQNWRDKNREDWQNWYEDRYHDNWHRHWHSHWWYGYPVSSVSFSFYIDDTPPCRQTVVINQATGRTSYYYCNSVWYMPAYASGEVRYVVTSPPAGAELASIPDPYRVTVGGQDYYVSNHVFYQMITRNGQKLYVTVDAPAGARVPTIPEYAVEIQHQGQSYYRFDRIFYQRQGDFFLVVNNPGVD